MFRAKLQLDLFRLRAVQCRFVVLTFWSKTSQSYKHTSPPHPPEESQLPSREERLRSRCGVNGGDWTLPASGDLQHIISGCVVIPCVPSQDCFLFPARVPLLGLVPDEKSLC